MLTRFGPSGNDALFYEQAYKSTVQAPEWIAKMGLTAFEYSFGRGIRMSDATAKAIGEECAKHNIAISAHAPYFINLAREWEKSYIYIERSLHMLKLMGGRNLVVHVGSQGDLDRALAIKNCKTNLKKVLSKLDVGFDFRLCIETMGRYPAIGDYKEICDICSVDKRVIPALDFGHINCLMQGALSKDELLIPEIMDYCMKNVGAEKMQNVHIHFSAIKFGAKGELGHLDFQDAAEQFKPLFEPLVKYIKAKKLSPTIICESANRQAKDALMLKEKFKVF